MLQLRHGSNSCEPIDWSGYGKAASVRGSRTCARAQDDVDLFGAGAALGLPETTVESVNRVAVGAVLVLPQSEMSRDNEHREAGARLEVCLG